MQRRNFIGSGLAALTAGITVPQAFAQAKENGQETSADPGARIPCPISLAQWSLRDEFRSGRLKNEDFASFSKNTFGISAVEYVSGFFKDKAKDKSFLKQLKQNSAIEGVTNVLIMIDGEGSIGAETLAERTQTVENHKKWVEAAQFIGCHTIRVNAHGTGTEQEQAKQATDGLRALSTFASDFGINVVVENHGGLSSNGQWLSKVLADVKMDNCGALPDFGNFGKYDRYQGIADLMPFAKGVSAKCINFDKNGNVIETDFAKAMKIVLDTGFRSWVGIEWGGRGATKAIPDIKAAKLLLDKVQQQYFDY
ncbi:sugar phosphate isomerase/epimerase family protein [Rubritalea profundi]|uniref:Xylose isomerase-like TIM barrel domain-containing protein n=1 Tax=Rubritalea profundi TaxID=1658618 RepID=A0A2S7U0K6_9BACT|nr:TIM barrel protein [Rubritalea profundi]PQJ28536.1 hypothetical protein BSZ32_08455 [Rubritalea profundi]